MNLKELARRYPLTIVVERGAGYELPEALARETGLERHEAALLVRRGGVWHGRRRMLEPQWRPAAGAELILHTPPGGAYQSLELSEDDLLYEDQWLLALNKQPGWFVVQTPWDIQANIEAALRRLYAARGGEPPALHLAHRLDRDTSGVLLVAKDSQVNAPLLASFQTGGVRKRYLALAAGRIEQAMFEMRTGHGRGVSGLFRIYPAETIGQQIGPQQRAIKEAWTSFKVLEHLTAATLVEAQPYTGRTHQIRLHLTALGHPILGDRRYAGPVAVGDLELHHHLLHAHELELAHPATGQPLSLRAPLPMLFAAALDRLRARAPLDSNSDRPYNS